MKNNPDRYALMGNPVEHSPSPWLHQLFAKQTQQSISYEKILVPLDHFPEAVKDFFQHQGKGLNITLPFKQEAYQLVDELTQRSRLAGAVNTIALTEEGTLLGDNTDGIGLIRDLQNNHGIKIANQQILILGASGAARGAIGPILEKQPAILHIANRTANKAHELAKLFTKYGKVQASGLDTFKDESFDIIINATSASLHGEVPAIPPTVIGHRCCCYDMFYSKEPTVFLRWAKQHGAKQCFDGLGMLIEQGAESFYVWRGVHPDTHAALLSFAKNTLPN